MKLFSVSIASEAFRTRQFKFQ